jgi:hypothetical protein
MNLEPVARDLGALLDMIDDGRIQLPEFQRPPTWRKRDEEELLRTVARGWPCGVLLALTGTGDLKYQRLADAPTGTQKPEFLLLDGQQRLTALHRAYRNRGKRTFFIDMGAVVSAGALRDMHLTSLSNTQFTKKYGNLGGNAAQKVARISTLVDDNEFDEWLGHLADQTTRPAYITARKEVLSGFRAYSLYVTFLPATTDLGVVAKIFETLNKTGVVLAVFDLVVAKVYSRAFNLRDRWEDAKKANPVLIDFGATGMDVLRVIALAQAVDPRAAPSRVKGVRQEDVLSLDASAITKEWAPAVKALSEAYRWLRVRCGMKNAAFIPSPTMILPLAHMFSSRKEWRPGFEDDLARWVWSTALEQKYAQGANTQAVSDARVLLAWNTSKSAVPAVVSDASAVSLEDAKQRLLRLRSRNEMIARATFSLVLSRGALDWYGGPTTLLQEKADLQVHHVLPTGRLRKHGSSKEDRIANLTPLLTSTNQSIGEDPPSLVKSNVKVTRSAIESHGIDWDTFVDSTKPDDDGILQARAEQLARWLLEKLKA